MNLQRMNPNPKGTTAMEQNVARETSDSELLTIERRHREDARWFEASWLHDPNSYVTMAHKDRGVLLERLMAGPMVNVSKPMTVVQLRTWLIESGFADLLQPEPPTIMPDATWTVRS